MTKESVIASAKFWLPGAWNTYSLYVPSTLGESENAAYQVILKSTILDLYSALSSAATMLENLANSGNLRIGSSPLSLGPAFWVRANAGSSGNDAYILADPAQGVWTINAQGNLFRMDFRVIFAHEVGYSAGKVDSPIDSSIEVATDVMMNGTGYNYKPSSVIFENQVATALTIADHRVSYAAAVGDADPRLSTLSTGKSFTEGETVQIVRFGDQHTTLRANNIDLSGWSSNPSVLAFGF